MLIDKEELSDSGKKIKQLLGYNLSGLDLNLQFSEYTDHNKDIVTEVMFPSGLRKKPGILVRFIFSFSKGNLIYSVQSGQYKDWKSFPNLIEDLMIAQSGGNEKPEILYSYSSSTGRCCISKKIEHKNLYTSTYEILDHASRKVTALDVADINSPSENIVPGADDMVEQEEIISTLFPVPGFYPDITNQGLLEYSWYYRIYFGDVMVRIYSESSLVSYRQSTFWSTVPTSRPRMHDIVSAFLEYSDIIWIRRFPELDKFFEGSDEVNYTSLNLSSNLYLVFVGTGDYWVVHEYSEGAYKFYYGSDLRVIDCGRNLRILADVVRVMSFC